MSNAVRYTAQGRRDAAARRDAQLEERRRHIASLSAEEFLVDVVGYASADRVPADLREDLLVEWHGCRAEHPEQVPA